MTDRDIDEILKRAAEAPGEVDPALLDRVSASMGASLKRVRPVAPAWMLASWLWLISAGVAVAAAGALGLDGILRLSGAEIGAIFPGLAIFTWLAALLSVAGMTPGGLRWKNPAVMEPVMANPGMLPLVVIVGFLAVDVMLFHDYQLGSFVTEGIPCLRAGLVVAIPTGIAGWLVLRHGFAVNPAAAGLAAGTLAGLAGLTMLELHCANFRAMHVMAWHTAVIPISALAGPLLARIVARRG
jgi:hypothetical protein